MTASEARRYQWQQLKGQPLSAKLKHIFTFYWPVIIACVCVIGIAVSWIGNILGQKELVLCGFFPNSALSESYQGDFGEEFLAHLNLDPEKNEFRITSNISYSKDDRSESSIYVMESMVTQVAAGELDFFVVDEESYPAFSSYYADLRTVLSAEQLDRWSANLIYAEQADLQKWSSGDLGQELVYPKYSATTDGMTDPIPMGIRLPETCRLRQAYLFPQGDVIFSVCASAQHQDNVLAFLEYILE